MDDQYRIRQGRPADLPAIVAIEQTVFTDPWSERALEDALRAGSFVAERTDAVIGYVFLRSAADEGEIVNMAVASEHQRRGVGRRLLEAACERLRDAGVRRVFLEVRESNDVGQGFYEAMGFRSIGRRSRYYRNPPESAVVLIRDLPPSEGTA